MTKTHGPSIRVSLERVLVHGLMRLPTAVQAGLAGITQPTPLSRELLHPQFQVLLAANTTRPPLHAHTVRTARADYRSMLHMLSPAPAPMAKSVDLKVPVPALGAARAEEILVRVHYPLVVRGQAPAIMFMHGGGFTVGDVPSYDAVCRDIAAQTGFPVASVEYRLAPEHPAPTATEDCTAAWSYLTQHAAELQLDPKRMAVMGDSAGGMLSAAVSQQAKHRGLPLPALQVLVYPGLDMVNDFPSKQRFSVGFGLEQATVEWFDAQFVQSEAVRHDTRVSPMLSDDLSGLPPAIVVVASDTLRDEGLLYAQRLENAGVSVEVLDYPALIHGFFTMGGVVPTAAIAVAEVLGRTRSRLG